MLVRIDVGDATVIDGEMQPVRRGGSFEQMVRRARSELRGSKLGLLNVRATLASNFDGTW